MARDFRGFVEASLRTLAAEAPAFHQRLCTTLAPRAVRISSDGQRFALRFARADVTVSESAGDERLSLAIDRSGILSLIDAALTLEEALRADVLDARGPIDDVVTMFEGLQIYLRGAVRCPSFPRLFEEFRGRGRREETLA